ncbi:MAG: hypothetical protein GF346_04275 [Candidatus Eisenbacteria bacterium]|nr:hypothetical protein [Candidatus Latescibacterota bacterium]MBD3301643.1 hypothetical protein [Candidatus Eisenbacteria bacterium]
MSLQRRRIAALLVAFLATGVASFAVAQGDEEVDPGRCASVGDVQLCTSLEFPGQGRPCWIVVKSGEVPIERAEVTVTYRPNSEVAETHLLGRTDASGRVRWRPAAAGIATITAEAEEIDPVELTVSVRFREPPWLGIAMLILAAMILFGGNGYAFAKTFARRA